MRFIIYAIRLLLFLTILPSIVSSVSVVVLINITLILLLRVRS